MVRIVAFLGLVKVSAVFRALAPFTTHMNMQTELHKGYFALMSWGVRMK